jgi:hypothetical protein
MRKNTLAFILAALARLALPPRAGTKVLKAKQGPPRLQIARGPGSISAKAEVDQLCWAGRFEEAEKLAREHFHACREAITLNYGNRDN